MSGFALALEMAASGFHVFPCRAGAKRPHVEGFPRLATTDAQQIEMWWYQWPSANVGVSTTAYNGGAFHLLVVDVDNKKKVLADGTVIEVSGDGTLLLWDLAGDKPLPATYTQHTPTGGRHLFYKTTTLCANTVGKLGAGIDTRGKGGYVLGRGSAVPAGSYEGDLSVPVADAPAWLIQAVGEANIQSAPAVAPPPEVRSGDARERAAAYLARCPVAQAGGRNAAAYKAACQVKDFGVMQPDCLELMASVWSVNCLPPLDDQELAAVVRSAYTYSIQAAGSAAPEVEFTPIADAPPSVVPPTPEGVDKMNEEYAYALAGNNGNILWFTTDEHARPLTRFLSKEAFHDLTSGRKVLVDDKPAPLSRLWMQSRKRRTYQGVVFSPGREVEARFYNLWRGFTVKPEAKGSARAHKALDAFLLHINSNIHGASNAPRWLTGFFAQLIQQPWEKPRTCVVLRGGKGAGKDTLINIVGHLLGAAYMNTTRKRHLLGDFNSHLENKLLFCLNEAFWSHDKQVQGVLQDLITGTAHTIERKGQEPYEVANMLRLVVMGNEDTLVPASADERRYTVFDIRPTNVVARTAEAREFFREMRLGMEAGGYSLLLNYLQQYDLKGVDLDEAVETEALHDHKIEGLDPLHQWWRESLEEGRLICSDFAEGWQHQADKELLRTAYRRYRKERQISGREPQQTVIGKMLVSCCKSLVTNQKRREGTKMVPVYRLPELDAARAEWDKFIGHAGEWE